jgi:Zn-dependent M16 (insulinase) family peptidase
MFDSWLYDDSRPFLHLETDGTFRFLKEQISSRYYEELVETYFLKNPHGSFVSIVPEKGLTAKKRPGNGRKAACL